MIVDIDKVCELWDDGAITLKEVLPMKLSTASKPCCAECVVANLEAAGFPYAEPFITISNLKPGRAARSMLAELLDSNPGRVFVLVSDPTEAEPQANECAQEVKPGEDGEPLGESELRDVLGLGPDESIPPPEGRP